MQLSEMYMKARCKFNRLHPTYVNEISASHRDTRRMDQNRKITSNEYSNDEKQTST